MYPSIHIKLEWTFNVNHLLSLMILNAKFDIILASYNCKKFYILKRKKRKEKKRRDKRLQKTRSLIWTYKHLT